MSEVSIRTRLARSIRGEALALLGGRCKSCSGTTDLQFHIHFDDAGAHHKFGSIKRAKFYLACAKLGDASLLCRTCHTHAHSRLRAQRNNSVRSVSYINSEHPQGQGTASGFSDSI